MSGENNITGNPDEDKSELSEGLIALYNLRQGGKIDDHVFMDRLFELAKTDPSVKKLIVQSFVSALFKATDNPQYRNKVLESRMIKDSSGHLEAGLYPKGEKNVWGGLKVIVCEMKDQS